jgi:N6-adenosine-specific RNA methylase IME4
MSNSVNINNVQYNLAEIKRDEMDSWKSQCSLAFPVDKKYQIIYADPPWQYNNSSNISNKADSHYPVMSVEDLQMINIRNIADKDCTLYLWTSNPMLPKAISLIEHWGFVYKTVFKVWRKINADGSNVMVPGWWSRSSTELLIVATIGNPLKKYKCANHTEPQEYTSTRTAHSEKPDEIRECIENFMNVPNKIELFARKVVEGWDAWGLEVPGFYHVCDDAVVYENGKRSLGVQVNLHNKESNSKQKGRGNKALSDKIKANRSIPLGHKDDCACFVCKKLRQVGGGSI